MKSLVSALLLSSALCFPAMGDNLVNNSNFSGGAAICNGGPGGTCPGWTVTEATNGSSFLFNDDNKAVTVPAGVGFATFGGSMGQDDELSQVLVTIPGDVYTVSFQLAGTQAIGSVADQDFSVMFGGTQIFSETNNLTTTLTPYSFDVTATDAMTTLAFFGRNTPATDTMAFPSVMLSGGSTSNVPAPIVGAGIPGFIAAAGALIGLARRRYLRRLGE